MNRTFKVIHLKICFLYRWQFRPELTLTPRGWSLKNLRIKRIHEPSRLVYYSALIYTILFQGAMISKNFKKRNKPANKYLRNLIHLDRGERLGTYETNIYTWAVYMETFEDTLTKYFPGVQVKNFYGT
jgi:hypothetical protein